MIYIGISTYLYSITSEISPNVSEISLKFSDRIHRGETSLHYALRRRLELYLANGSMYLVGQFLVS